MTEDIASERWNFFGKRARISELSVEELQALGHVRTEMRDHVAKARALTDAFNRASDQHGKERDQERSRGRCIERFCRHDYQLQVHAQANELGIVAQSRGPARKLAIFADAKRIAVGSATNVLRLQGSSSNELELLDPESWTKILRGLLGLALAQVTDLAVFVGAGYLAFGLLFQAAKYLALALIWLLPPDLREGALLLLAGICAWVNSALQLGAIGTLGAGSLATVFESVQRFYDRRALSREVRRKLVSRLVSP